MNVHLLFLLACGIAACVNGAGTADVAKGAPPAGGTCSYALHVPRDLDVPSTPYFDTTIVRAPGCATHRLRFPAQGTETEYILGLDTVVRTLHFYFEDTAAAWLDITALPAGAYRVQLLACGNGGNFTIRIH